MIDFISGKHSNVIFVLLLLFALCGCQSEPEPEPGPPPGPDQTAQLTDQWWYCEIATGDIDCECFEMRFICYLDGSFQQSNAMTGTSESGEWYWTSDTSFIVNWFYNNNQGHVTTEYKIDEITDTTLVVSPIDEDCTFKFTNTDLQTTLLTDKWWYCQTAVGNDPYCECNAERFICHLDGSFQLADASLGNLAGDWYWLSDTSFVANGLDDNGQAYLSVVFMVVSISNETLVLKVQYEDCIFTYES